MKRPRTGLILIDILLLSAAYVLMASLKPIMVSYLNTRYLVGFGVTVFLWMWSSFYLKKYHVGRREHPSFLLHKIVYPNLLALAFVAFIIYAFNTTFYSRMMVFGTFGVATMVEMIFFSLYSYIILSREYDAASAFLEQPPTSHDIRKIKQAVIHSNLQNGARFLHEALVEECGENAALYIERHIDLHDKKNLIISTATRFNILRQPDKHFSAIINLLRINDIRQLNKFFESVNHKLPDKGTFIGCAETADLRKKRILAKFPPVLNWIAYTGDYIIKRVFPKFYPTRGIYFFLTRGNNRVLTRAEVLGRLYACGFEVVEETYVDQKFFFVTRRIKDPAFDINPTYGPFITLNRIGKGGEMIRVYKLRTMSPYAEYLQDYVHKLNSLDKGGKFKSDFRISPSRSILRKLWIDEFPMIINLIRGDLKLVGVRPISKHYFSLYSKELQEKRIRYRPGLIPPFYVDLPNTLEEIEASEMRYLDAFEKHPVRTQFRYFWKALFNIVFKKARSA